MVSVASCKKLGRSRVSAAYAPAPKRTEYRVALRQTNLHFIPQYEDADNAVTLDVTNDLLPTVMQCTVGSGRRDVHSCQHPTDPALDARNCFAEFFFRSVVLEYLQGDVLKDTIAVVAILLEPNEYNLVDMDTVWRRQASKSSGTIRSLRRASSSMVPTHAVVAVAL